VAGPLGLGTGLRKLIGGVELWPLVMGICVLLYLGMLAFDTAGMLVTDGGIGFLVPSVRAFFTFGASGVDPMLGYGRWWTVLSAGWLHGNLLHILFNLMWVRQLAPAVQHLYGPGRSLIIYTLASATGFLFSTLSVFLPDLPLIGGGARFTVGASAALFGLLAALIHYSRRGGRSELGQQVWTWAIALFAIGLLMPGAGVDNWAHLGGFVGGWLLSYVFDPLRPERPAHLVGGAICLVASLAAVVLSVVTALRLLG
jgi:rhomboid protease GluP